MTSHFSRKGDAVPAGADHDMARRLGLVAFVETYATVYHHSRPTPEGNLKALGRSWAEERAIDPHASHDLVAGVRYTDRFERRGDERRIAEHTPTFDEPHVLPGNARAFGAFGPSTIVDRRDPQDHSYRRPGGVAA